MIRSVELSKQKHRKSNHNDVANLTREFTNLIQDLTFSDSDASLSHVVDWSFEMKELISIEWGSHSIKKRK